MTTHYQIHASLAVLGFLLHQSEWTIECKDKKIAAHCEENLARSGPRLLRALKRIALVWLRAQRPPVGERCPGQDGAADQGQGPDPRRVLTSTGSTSTATRPRWHVKPKLKVYDGIKQFGAPWPIPAEATCWYPLLMRERGLLRQEASQASLHELVLQP
jgi:hypothetical protein